GETPTAASAGGASCSQPATDRSSESATPRSSRSVNEATLPLATTVLTSGQTSGRICAGGALALPSGAEAQRGKGMHQGGLIRVPRRSRRPLITLVFVAVVFTA